MLITVYRPSYPTDSWCGIRQLPRNYTLVLVVWYSDTHLWIKKSTFLRSHPFILEALEWLGRNRASWDHQIPLGFHFMFCVNVSSVNIPFSQQFHTSFDWSSNSRNVLCTTWEWLAKLMVEAALQHGPLDVPRFMDSKQFKTGSKLVQHMVQHMVQHGSTGWVRWVPTVPVLGPRRVVARLACESTLEYFSAFRQDRELWAKSCEKIYSERCC